MSERPEATSRRWGLLRGAAIRPGETSGRRLLPLLPQWTVCWGGAAFGCIGILFSGKPSRSLLKMRSVALQREDSGVLFTTLKAAPGKACQDYQDSESEDQGQKQG